MKLKSVFQWFFNTSGRQTIVNPGCIFIYMFGDRFRILHHKGEWQKWSVNFLKGRWAFNLFGAYFELSWHFPWKSYAVGPKPV
jgi:hypothetical protein